MICGSIAARCGLDPAPAGYQYRAGVVLLRITLTTNDQRERNMPTLPMVMHRLPPDGARIKQQLSPGAKSARAGDLPPCSTDDPAPLENGAVRLRGQSRIPAGGWVCASPCA